MKHQIKWVVLIIIITFSSCKAPYYTIGMSEREFLKHNRVQAVEQTTHQSVYKKTNYPFGAAPKTKFFYFQDGYLTEVNEGVRQPDIIIQNQH